MSSKSTTPRSSTSSDNLAKRGRSGFLSSGHTGNIAAGATGFNALRGSEGNSMGGESYGASAAQIQAGGSQGLGGVGMGGGLSSISQPVIAAGWGMPTSFLEQMEASSGALLDGLSGTAASMASNWGETAAGGIGSIAGGLGSAASAASGLLPW